MSRFARLIVAASLIATTAPGTMGAITSVAMPETWPACDDDTAAECWTNLTVDEAPAPASLSLTVFEMEGMLQFQVTWESENELLAPSSPLSSESLIGFQILTGEFDAALVIGSFLLESMSLPTDDDPSVTLAMKPLPISFVMGTCIPGNCGDDETTADVDYQGFIAGAISGPVSPPSGPSAAAVAAPARGSFYSTNAQAFGLPDVSASGVGVQVAAAHLRADGTDNVGLYRAFLPMDIVDDLWGVSDTPEGVAGDDFVSTAQEGDTTESLDHEITPVTDPSAYGSTGILIEITNLHFSSPTVKIAPTVVPGISLRGFRGAEGHRGTRAFTFTATLSRATTRAVTVPWITQPGSARAGSDFLSARGTLSFAAGKRTARLVVRVKGDRTYERNETFKVRLGTPTNATVATRTALGTIVNDDRRR